MENHWVTEQCGMKRWGHLWYTTLLQSFNTSRNGEKGKHRQVSVEHGPLQSDPVEPVLHGFAGSF